MIILHIQCCFLLIGIPTEFPISKKEPYADRYFTV